MVASTALALHPPMPHPKRPTCRPRTPLEVALDGIEIPPCDCKLTMLPVCVVGKKPGCRTLRKTANCECRRRLLPVCLVRDGNGCERRREGKGCECEQMFLPECVALGCEERQEGHLCECPRWPGEPCSHVNAYAERMRREGAFLALERMFPDETRRLTGCEGQENNRPCNLRLAGKPCRCVPFTDRHTLWARVLWLTKQPVFGDRRLPSRGAPMVDRQARVEMMALRRKWKLSLWHPDDIRSPLDGTDQARLRQNAGAFFRRLGVNLQAGQGVQNGQAS